MSKNYNKYLYTFISIIIFSFMIVVSAQTEDPDPVSGEDDQTPTPLRNRIEMLQQKRLERQRTLEEKKMEIQEKKQERIERVCYRAREKVQATLQRYLDNENRYQGFFNGIEVKLTNLISKGTAAGLDTTELENDLEELRIKIADARTTLEDYAASLEAADSLACGESEGEYREEILNARANIRALRATVQELRDFYVQEIKPDLLDLREQRKELLGDTEDESEDKNVNKNKTEENDEVEDQDELNDNDDTDEDEVNDGSDPQEESDDETENDNNDDENENENQNEDETSEED